MTIRPRRAFHLATALMFVALSGACGGGDNDAAPPSAATSTGSAPGKTSACPLKAEDVSTAIGVAMQQSSTARCGFVAQSPPAGQVIEVYYSPIDAMVFEGSQGEPVTGVGEGARWDTQMAGSLLVKKGSRHFSVQAVAMGELPDNLRPKNLAITVAKLVLTDSGR